LNQNLPQFGENAPLFQIVKKILLLFRYFLVYSLLLTLKQIHRFSSNFNSFSLFFSLKYLRPKNSAIFPLLSTKIDSGTAIKMLPLLGIIFRYI
jgi:hypothetical protein